MLRSWLRCRAADALQLMPGIRGWTRILGPLPCTARNNHARVPTNLVPLKRRSDYNEQAGQVEALLLKIP